MADRWMEVIRGINIPFASDFTSSMALTSGAEPSLFIFIWLKVRRAGIASINPNTIKILRIVFMWMQF